MAKLVKFSCKLTQYGKNHIRRINKAIEKAASMHLGTGINDIVKPHVVELAPNYEQEATMISQGYTSSGKKLGISYKRFYKSPYYVSVQEALVHQRVTVRNEGHMILGEFGDPRLINPLIGFSWLTRTGDMSLERRSTSDPEAGEAWKGLIEAWEYGDSDSKGGKAGSGFTVRRRDKDIAEGKIFLNVDDVHRVISIDKKIPGGSKHDGFHMFHKGGTERKKMLSSYMRDKIAVDIKGK